MQETTTSAGEAPSIGGGVSPGLEGAPESGRGPTSSPGARGRPRSKKRTVREAMLVVHRWLTFLLGIVLFLVAGSGAILVYQHELDEWLNADRFDPTPGDVGWQEARRVLEEARPDAHMDLLWWPRPLMPYYEAYFIHPEGSAEQVAVDPGTGRLVADVAEPNRLMSQINRFHQDLLAGEFGRWLVLASTAAAILLSLTGLWLWWPGIKGFFRGFRIRLRRGFYPFNFDLHQVAGTLTAPTVLLMSLTGFGIAFPGATRDLLHGVTGEEVPAEPLYDEIVSERPDGWTEDRRPPSEELLRRAHEEVPGAETFYITFPAEPDAPVQVRLQTGVDPWPFGIISRVYFDQYTGEIIYVDDPRRKETSASRAEEWIDPLHMGHFWGHFGRILYIVCCLMVVGLFMGGLYIWWEKRRRVARAEARRARREWQQPPETSTRV